MTTARQAAANRANSRLAKGPKTALGKAQAAANARRHGLAVSVRSAGAFAADIAALARHFAGPDASTEVGAAARRVAEAQLDVVRVRSARRQPIGPDLNQGPEPTANELLASCQQRVRLDRYERRAMSRRQRAINDLDTLRIIEAVSKTAAQLPETVS